MSKLPDPVAWSVTWQSTHCGNFFFRSEDAAEHKNRLGAKFPDEQREIVPLYSEAQVKELLANADKEMSDGFLIVHMNAANRVKKRYEPVLRQALEALNAISSGVCEAAHHPKKDQHTIVGVLCPIEKRHDEAIEAIRKVLEP